MLSFDESTATGSTLFRAARVRLLNALLLVTVGIPVAHAGAPSSLNNLQADRTVRVDRSHSKASDSNPGTASLPLRTISAATQIAMGHNRNGLSTKILISPGVYREEISLSRGGTDAAIVFEATQARKTIITGSDIWKGWTNSGGVFNRSWPHRWGLAPDLWQPQVALNEIVRRREIVFLNNAPLQQVLSFSALRDETFYVSESNQRIYIKSKSNVSTATVEVGVRRGLFVVEGRRNIVLKGLVFQHDTTPVQNGAVWFNNSRNILIEDCEFRWNNWAGLSFTTVRNVTSRRNKINHNGGAGWMGFEVASLFSENDETSYNNWRGASGGFFGWAVAGAKFFGLHDAIFRGIKSVGNQTRGLWFDTDIANVQIEDALACKNLTDGMFLEASQGPVSVEDSTFMLNKKTGLLSNYARNVTLNRNSIYSNGPSSYQIIVNSGNNVERTFKNWETGALIAVKPERWTLTNNTIAARSNDLLISIGLPQLQRFIDTLQSSKNTWYHTSRSAPFILGPEIKSFASWQAATGRDQDSIFKQPTGINLNASSCSLVAAAPTPTVPTASGVIVDNRGSNTSRTGSWQVSAGTNPWNSDSLYSNSGGTFRWKPSVSEAGNYEVYAWWTHHQNRATSVPYRIKHADGTATVRVNQRDSSKGGRWVLLGRYNFTAGGSGYVEVSSENGQASADAVRLVRVGNVVAPTPSSSGVVVDNRGTNTSRTGTWRVSSGTKPWNGESLYSDGGGTFRWRPNLSEAGSYDVYAWWTYHQNRATNVPYRIKHTNGTATVRVNQRDSARGGRWIRLGRYNFAAGGNGYVEVSSENGQACADAIKMTKVE